MNYMILNGNQMRKKNNKNYSNLMNTKKKLFHIKNDVFKDELNVAVGYSAKELEEMLKKRECAIDDKFINDLKFANGAVIETENKTGKIFILWLNNFNHDVRSHGLLVHEVSHAIFAMLNFRGVQIDTEKDISNETYAYTLEFFYTEILKRLNRHINNSFKTHAKKTKMPRNKNLRMVRNGKKPRRFQTKKN